MNPTVSRMTTFLAAALAFAITISVPAAYVVISFQFIRGTLDTEAETSAAAITRVVMANPTMWQFEQMRLSELLDRRPFDRTKEHRLVRDNTGALVAESDDKLQKPLISGSYEIFDAGVAVGHVEILRSMWPVLMDTALVAVVSLTAGIVVFILLRVLPMRVVQRAYSFLEESERRYRSLYESMKEGVALHRIDHDQFGVPVSFSVVDVNSACQMLLKLDREQLVGRGGSDIYGETVAGYLPEILRAASLGETFSFDFAHALNGQRIHVAVFFPEPGYFAFLMEDVTQRKITEEQIKRLAYFDSLTGLPNRALLLDRLEQALAGARRDKTRVGLLYLDLDRFKVVNDTMGHAQGDSLLVQVAARLRQALRSSDTLARIGGDEFVVLVSHDGEEVSMTHLAQHLVDNVTAVYPLSSRDVYTSTSIGIAVFPEDAIDCDSLLRCADMAMYAAKEKGGSGFHFYSADMNLKAHARMELETSLRYALEHEQFFLEFQPIVSGDGLFSGAEALLRLSDPEQGRVMPAMFISVAEESGFIIPLGEWVLRTACRKMKAWCDAGLPPFLMSVNVSGRQFNQAGFTDTVYEIVRETGVDPRFLALEMTETSLMVDPAATTEALLKLKELGITIVVDDFGAGYSSLGYLKQFPMDRIKIDRSFIKDISSSANDRAIVEAIIAMAARLDLQVVAEGVETKAQLDFLLDHGCHEIQGYYFHRPLTEEMLITLLQELQQRSVPLFECPEAGPIAISLASC